jgi:hypothetical protein
MFFTLNRDTLQLNMLKNPWFTQRHLNIHDLPALKFSVRLAAAVFAA